jgi:hypothetical protein
LVGERHPAPAKCALFPVRAAGDKSDTAAGLRAGVCPGRFRCAAATAKK